jgi:hypothetical protein
MSERNLMALRLTKLNTILVKEIDTPVSFILNITDPLTDHQTRMLSVAAPWRPLKILAHVGEWNNILQAMDAEVLVIETPPKQQAPKHKQSLRWGLVKRKRGYFSHD